MAGIESSGEVNTHKSGVTTWGSTAQVRGMSESPKVQVVKVDLGPAVVYEPSSGVLKAKTAHGSGGTTSVIAKIPEAAFPLKTLKEQGWSA